MNTSIIYEIFLKFHYLIITGFKNLRYNVFFPSRINCNPKKSTVFAVLDCVISDMMHLI